MQARELRVFCCVFFLCVAFLPFYVPVNSNRDEWEKNIGDSPWQPVHHGNERSYPSSKIIPLNEMMVEKFTTDAFTSSHNFGLNSNMDLWQYVSTSPPIRGSVFERKNPSGGNRRKNIGPTRYDIAPDSEAIVA
jgi:hypothetical protein